MAGRFTTPHKIVVLGDGGVGKTALTIQLCLQHFIETYDPTIEDSYRKQVVIDGQACMLEVLDTAGQEEYTALRDQWIRDGEGFVLVYSISSRSSFSRIKRFHHQIYRVKESTGGSSSYPGSPMAAAGGPINVPIMLVGNKSDRVTEREVSTQEGHALARELGCEFVEASAKNCINVEKAFFDVVRIIRRQNAASYSSGGGSRPANGAAPGRRDTMPEDRRYRRKGDKNHGNMVQIVLPITTTGVYGVQWVWDPKCDDVLMSLREENETARLSDNIQLLGEGSQSGGRVQGE
ncbi:ras-2 protein [Diaporthe amygdali]|uniref:ras-2 protein n=1 Tax=Phomopsis amygdali TaxID=1214568 RepID=UPI0022FE967F|nr:ras-2 protein [Diaporthe amygdali]KAJ0120053.1 ras-2 protein [Diaporthe amygdali]